MPGRSLIEGVVLDAHGQPVAGARISWVRAPVPLPDVALLTDGQGRFTLAAPAAGAYTLRCDSDAQGSVEKTLNVSGSALRIKIQLPR